MIGTYAYTPSIWPSVLTAILLLVLAVYSWRRRSVPGALPFAISCLSAAMWAACSVLEYAAVDLATKIFWVKIQPVWQFPVAIAITCFILEYAWPGRWLTRRNLVLLCIPWLLTLVLMLTDNLHHLIWRSFVFNGSVQPQIGPGGWLIGIYPFGVLVVLDLIVFGWLFVRSPQHRWPVVIMLIGQIGGRMLYMTERVNIFHSVLPLDLLGMAFEFLMYAIALFRFRILDPIPLARQTAIDQLHAGMLVLDSQGKIVSLNPAAGAILGSPAKRLLSRPIQDLLPACSEMVRDLQAVGTGQVEISRPGAHKNSVGNGPDTRYYHLEASSLRDWRGLEVGYLLLLHDVTGQKRTQAQLLEQQRALAMLQERERLARELHDSLAQVLGYVKIQAQAARDWLAQDKKDAAESSLAKLVVVAQEAHTDVREYILGAKTAASLQSGFLPALRQYLKNFSELYSLRTELIAPPDWVDGKLEPMVAAQLLRIIQEALTNTRKHAQAQCVEVVIQSASDHAQVTVQDDGVGFDPALLADGERQKYGLGFMRERAKEVDGSVEIYSAPAQGTRVVVNIPLRGSFASTSG